MFGKPWHASAMKSEVTLSDACELIVDCPHKTAPTSEVAFAYAVGTKAIDHGRIQFENARPVDQATYEEWIARGVPREGDIILCREAPVGPAARVPNDPRVCLGQRTVLLRPDPDNVNPRFLLYALLAPVTQSALREISEGSTVPHLNVADIRRFSIEVPSITKQSQIAAVLGALDDKIDSNRRLSRLLEQIVATEFRARFVDFVGVDDLVDSQAGPIPLGWTSGELGEIGAPHRDLVKGENGLPYIGLDLMPRASTVLTAWQTENAPTGHAARFEPGDILFGKLRPYFRKVGLAPIAGRCSTEILVLRPAKPEYLGVLLGHAASQSFIDHCVAVSRGTRMPRAEWKDASTFQIPIPPPDIAAQFTEMCRTTYRRIMSATAESRTLEAIRDGLLPRLISEEIGLSDSADPAETIDALVERHFA